MIGLSGVAVLGVAAQWFAWRLRFPSILLLLGIGLLVGPGAELALGHALIDPDALFGPLLLPLTSLAVALILYEGGLSLRLGEIADVEHVVRNLCTIGAAVTWLGAAGAAWLCGLLSPGPALLLGAILVVTGPTVIVPLLRQIRIRGQAGSLLKWEGIVSDPLGACLAVLVFEALLAGTVQAGLGHAAIGFLRAGAAGGVLGCLGAGLLILLERRHWVPHHLENPVSLAIVVAVFTLSNLVQGESGLIATTVMGCVVGNVLKEEIHPITAFKESLQVLLIGGLFVVLAARLDLADLKAALGWESLLFLALLVFVVRPAAVFLATVGSGLLLRERAFLAGIAPRGIVAAAVVSVFGARLAQAGLPGAERLVPLAFLVILATVAFYGLSAGPLSRLLDLREPTPTGVMLLGAQDWARDLAGVLREAGLVVLLIDTNRYRVKRAREEGLWAVHANALSEFVSDELDLSGIGTLLTLTPNDAVNTLAAARFEHSFGRANVFQIQPQGGGSRHDVAPRARSRYLLQDEADHDWISQRAALGWRFRACQIREGCGLASWRETHGAQVVPVGKITLGGPFDAWTNTLEPSLAEGDVLIGFASPETWEAMDAAAEEEEEPADEESAAAAGEEPAGEEGEEAARDTPPSQGEEGSQA